MIFSDFIINGCVIIGILFIHLL